MPVKIIVLERWSVEREGRIEEVTKPGHNPRYRVVLADVGRTPFLQKWFNDLTRASDFVDRVKTGFDPREQREASS